MCDMPLKSSIRAQNSVKEFDTGWFVRIIHEFKELGIPGIGFTGGEPLLRDDIFKLLAETRRKGMISHLNTNGWLLDDETALKLIDIGVDSVNVSLDGATAATHDRIRKPGSYDHVLRAMDRLISLRTKYRSNIRLKTVAVDDETNLEEIPQLFSLLRNLGTDCVELIPRQPFASTSQANMDISPELAENIVKLTEYLLDHSQHNMTLENSQSHISLFQNSFAGSPSPVKCYAGFNSLAVDCYGDVFPCVPWINWGKAVGNVADDSLIKFWHSHDYHLERKSLSKCRACYLNCQTELNLLFGRPKM
jgi:MoaA/NifB/PqqE/SkfB family radical SAM enzyme